MIMAVAIDSDSYNRYSSKGSQFFLTLLFFSSSVDWILVTIFFHWTSILSAGLIAYNIYGLITMASCFCCSAVVVIIFVAAVATCSCCCCCFVVIVIVVTNFIFTVFFLSGPSCVQITMAISSPERRVQH